jgi:hypothetical protein
MRSFCASVLLAAAVAPAWIQADDLPDPDVVASAMRRASDFAVARLASHGGYASAWKRDLATAMVEGKTSRTVISIQPPGTTTVGLAMLRAWEATGDDAFLAAARGAARALMDCQLVSGGWESDFDFEGGDPQRHFLRRAFLAGDTDQGKRRNESTLDDNKTQSALLFLLELAHTVPGRSDPDLQAALRHGMDGLLAAQNRIGSWPQKFDGPAPQDGIVAKASIPEDWPKKWPDAKYSRFHTLNDGNLERIVHLLLRAHDLTGEDRYRNAARRVGDFLLLAQFDPPQAGWAQQYNERMEPVWARKFEPPSLSSSESFGAAATLFELWLATGDEAYRASLPGALDWLERSRLPGGGWARFYELRTNRPLYCEAGSYRLTYEDSNLPTHYGFKIADSLQDKITRLRADLGRSREELLSARRVPDSPGAWAKAARNLRGKVRAALESQAEEGVWLNDDGEIDAELLGKHLTAMASYVHASRRASASR